MSNLHKRNGYICEVCKTKFVCIDSADGVTPASIGCIRRGCDGTMWTGFYADIFQTMTPQYEWYRPGKAEMKRLRKQKRLRPTVKAIEQDSHLLLRHRTTKELVTESL